jgi:hypothetical protein
MLDLKLKAMLDRIAAVGAPDIGDLPPEVGRSVYREILTAGDLPPADRKPVDSRTGGIAPGAGLHAQGEDIRCAGPRPLPERAPS